MKICPKCKKTKDVLGFSKDKRSKDNLQYLCKQCNAKYYKANQEERDTYTKRRRLESPGKYRVYNKKYRAENPKKIKAIHKKHRIKNSEKINARVRKWAKRNPDKCREKVIRYRTRKLNAYVAPVDRQEIFNRDNGVCHICGKEVDPSNWHLDHIFPLSRGGTHEPKNVAVSHPKCNMQKSTKCIRRIYDQPK